METVFSPLLYTQSDEDLGEKTRCPNRRIGTRLWCDVETPLRPIDQYTQETGKTRIFNRVEKNRET